MAGGAVTVAALRHRPRQALLVIVLAAIVTGAAVLGPLYARAVEQSVLTTVVGAAPVVQSGIVVVATGDSPPSPSRIAQAVASRVPAQFGEPVLGGDAAALVQPDAGLRYRSRLASRTGACRHLELAVGRCLQDDGEVLVSRRTARTLDVEPGHRLLLLPPSRAEDDSPDDNPAGEPDAINATVVGVYEPVDPEDPFWTGRGQTGTQATRVAAAGDDLETVDDILTTWPTVSSGALPQVRSHVDLPVDAAALELAGLDALSGATQRVDRAADTVGASATSGLEPLLAFTQSQREQARTVIPLLTVQLAVLGVVVLGFVCAAATEQRRPEIALARLRGLGSTGAGGLLLRELGILVLAGAAAGAALGYGLAALAAQLWLQPGVSLEPTRWPVVVALLGAALAGLLAVVATAAPTVRQPLVSLLRRVPPRASALQAGIVEGAVVAAAGAGVVTLLSGGGGPVALLAPGLLAVAGGLLLSQAAVPAAAPLVQRSLRRGRVSGTLASVQVARRPALRRLIAIVTVACALLVFAVDAWGVSGRNRATRAAQEAGAPVVLTVAADSSTVLREAMRDIDPRGRFATPVVTMRSATETGPVTTAVEPEAFARIAGWGSSDNKPARAALARLQQDLADPVVLRGNRMTLTAAFSARGISPGPDQPESDPAPMFLTVVLAEPNGGLVRVAMGRLREGRAATYETDVPCGAGCRLRELVVSRTFGDFTDAFVTLDVEEVRVGSAGSLQPVDLDTASDGGWLPVPWRPQVPVSGAVAPGPTLRFTDESYGVPVSVQRGDVLVNPAALRAGQVTEVPPLPGETTNLVLAPDLQAGDLAYDVVGRVGQIPRSGPRGVLVDLAAVEGGPSATPATTSYDVWLAADDAVRERRLRTELERHGLVVTGRDTARAHEEAFEQEGPSLALRLAVLAGGVAVLLAAATLVVGVATSGASRARDLAGLRLVGVPAAAVRSAAVAEHLVVAALGVVAGSVLGLVAAQAALPSIPLFARPSPRLPVVLDPVWPAVLATAAASLLLLAAVSVLVGRALAASATPERLREER